MKNLLKTFIQRHFSHCLLMLCMIEPVYRNYIVLDGALLYVVGAVFLFFVLYPLVISPILIALRPQQVHHKESKESLLLTIFICALGIGVQSLSSPDGFSFNAINSFLIFFMVASVCDLIPAVIKGDKEAE